MSRDAGTPTGAPQLQPAHADYSAVVSASFARQGLMRHLGARLARIEPGRVVIEAAMSPGLTEQRGNFHGGAIGAIGDSAGGYAALTLLAEGSEVVTVEYKINFVRPAAGSLLRATGQVLRPGRTITVARIDVEAGAEGAMGIAAVLQATYMRVPA